MTEEVQAPTETLNNESGMTIQDIAMAVQVIDLACERGGFKGPEMQVIGELRGRLAGFVQANTPAAPEGEESAEEAAE